VVVSHKFATLHELQTVYGAEDLYNFLEIISVDRHNERVMSERKE
jgi:hypothetical protein